MSMSQQDWAARVAAIGKLAGWHGGRIGLISGLPPGYGILSWMEDTELCPAVIAAIRQLAADWLAREGVVAARGCRWREDHGLRVYWPACSENAISEVSGHYCPKCGGKIEVDNG